MIIAVLGQPNSGKSTLFNSVAGYKSVSSNFPGTTVNYQRSYVNLNGTTSQLIDFPGCYSLSSVNEAELKIRDYLISESIDIIINVVDASRLGKGLSFTLELLDLQIPMVLCLNMIDEASRKGISIDTDQLSDVLKIPVVPTIAVKNEGVKNLFDVTSDIVIPEYRWKNAGINYQRDIEKVILQLTDLIDNNSKSKVKIAQRFMAIKLLEGDNYFLKENECSNINELNKKSDQLRQHLATERGRPGATVMAMERYALAMEIFRKVSVEGKPKKDWREYADNLLMHKFLGYIIIALTFTGIFYLVFGLGSLLERPLLQGFSTIETYLAGKLNAEGFAFVILKGCLYGISGGIAVVLPYLVPFLIVLTLLEDSGYLPRVAYLMDSFMHRIGLHGTSILPLVLGYGCSVPAVMATRTLSYHRDKFITAVLVTLVPCSARSVVIFGLVAYYIGPGTAILFYIFNLFIVAVIGKVLSNLMPSVSPGMILELPGYKWPVFKSVFQKVWFRIREFIVIAWPLLIVGSIVLGIGEYYELNNNINDLLSPLTRLLGLPVMIGIPLVFGVLRKELTLIMLIQALGTSQVLSVMTYLQIMVFTIFIMFYIPCLATIAVLIKELGMRWTIAVIGITLFLATILSLVFKFSYTALY